MALPNLDATFASSVDLPRKQMLAKWLVEELGETQAPSSALVSGAGSDVNGLYLYDGTHNGKGKWSLSATKYIQAVDNGDGLFWHINNDDIDPFLYVLQSNTEYPWQGTYLTNNGAEPEPTVTEIPQPSPISNYYSLPERYLWAKIAVAVGAPRGEADYISLPKNYAWSDIYNAVASASGSHIDWTEKQALGHIAAAYRGDTGNPENLATYINWPWRYQVASIIGHLMGNYNAIIVSGAGSTEVNGTYTLSGQENGKNKYVLNGNYVAWTSLDNWWLINNETVNKYISVDNTEFPWDATFEVDFANEPPPTITPTNV